MIKMFKSVGNINKHLVDEETLRMIHPPPNPHCPFCHSVWWIFAHSLVFILHLKACTKDFTHISGSLETKMNTILYCLLVFKDGWQENSYGIQHLFTLNRVHQERNISELLETKLDET